MDNRVNRSATESLRNTEGHARILGPPASGKTSLLLDRFRQLESDGYSGRVIVIAYSRESRDLLLSQLLGENSARFGASPVFTYHQLAQQVIRALSPANPRLVGELGQAVVLRRAIRRVENELSSDYRRTARSAAFQKTVLGVVNALAQNGVAQRREFRTPPPGAPPRVSDLLRIYLEYRESLRTAGCYTFHDAAWIAARLLASRPDPDRLSVAGTEPAWLLVDDFQDIDPGQYEMIRAIAPPDGDVRINVFGDPTGARFRFRGTSDRFLLENFPGHYDPADVLIRSRGFSADGAGTVVDRLLAETCGRDVAANYVAENGGGPGVSLCVTEDEREEAVWIADSVVSLVDSGLYTPDDIVVAVRNRRRYETVLTRAFRDRGLLLDTGRSAKHPFVYFVQLILRLVDGRDTAGYALPASPFFRHLERVYCENTGEAAESLEPIRAALVRSAGTAGGRNGIDLRPLFDGWIKPLIRSAGVEDAAEDLRSFLATVETEWQQYCEIVDNVAGRRSLPEFMSLSGALSGENRQVRRAGRVGLHSCHELSSRRYPVVFLAGCSDLLFPEPPPGQDYIPWKQLTEALNAAGGDERIELPPARTAREFLRDEYALLLTALTRAESRLIVTAPGRFRGLSTPAPAAVLEGLGDGRAPAADTRTGTPYLRFAAALAGAGENPAVTGYPVGDWWTRPAVPAANIRIRLKRLSPTTIKLFTTCPVKAFYSRILRVEEDRSAGAAFGSLFHELMNRLSEHYRTHLELRSVIGSVRLDEHINKTMEKSEYFMGAPEVERTAARHHLREMAAGFLEIDGKRTDDYYITQSEKQVGFEWRGWGFGGVADRVDRIQGGTYVVIDYKTGAVKKTGVTIRRHSLPGFDKPEDRLWQVPLYTRGARPGDAILPEMFCYYVIQPGGECYPVGLVIGEETDQSKIRTIFGGAEPKRFSYLTKRELNACLDEAAEIATDIFADRTRFDKTDDRNRCSRCFYRRICERTV